MKKRWQDYYDKSEMFPSKNRNHSGGWNGRGQRGRGYRHSNNNNQQQHFSRGYHHSNNNNQQQHHFSRGYHHSNNNNQQQRFGRISEWEVSASYQQNDLRMRLEAAEEENRRLKKEAEERKKQEEEDAKAQSTKFNPFECSDDSDDDGGAPVFRSNKRRRHSPSPQRSAAPKKPKIEKFEPIYRCLEHLNFSQPETITHCEKEDIEFTDVVCKLFKDKVRTRDRLNYSTYGMVESYFPAKAPTVDPSDPNIFFLEGAPYDKRNDESVLPGSKELDWNNMSYEEFKSAIVQERNAFNLSSAKTKKGVYMYRISKAKSIREKVECYVNMINLEDEVTEELRATGEIRGIVNVNDRKLEMVRAALRTYGYQIELKLLEIDILTSMHGENSSAVKEAWNKLMTTFPNDLKMWRHRLTYFRNKRSLFNADTYIKENIFACLSRLGGIVNGTFKSHSKQHGTEEFLTDVIVAAASLYIELGAMHKAIGIIQALVEFFILTPTTVKSFDFKRKLDSFELFWKTPIPKAGDDKALGWNKVKTNGSYNKYNFQENSYLSKNEEERIKEAEFTDVTYGNIKFCKDNHYESDYYMWQALEKERTEKIWKPTYNEATVSLFNTYNSFDSIKPYLIQLPKEVIENAIYKVLIKLGAVIPNVKDYSHEGIYEKYFYEDATFKMMYADMDKFIDNILLLLSGANKEYYLLATIARLTTAQAFILKSKKTYNDAKKQFMQHLKDVFHTVSNVRELDNHEKLVINSYVFQIIEQMRLVYRGREAPVLSQDQRYIRSCIDIFVPGLPKPTLLFALRHFVMTVRKLPHFDGTEANMSKLEFLVKVTSLNAEVNHLSKKEQEKAIRKWKAANFHGKIFNLPPGTRWMGDVNAYALELLSTLCYESKVDATSKFEAFKEFFPENVLTRDEALAEFFFQAWQRHVHHYYEEKNEFLEELGRYVAEFYPRNDVLAMLYISNLQRDEMALRVWFMQNKSEDDITKGIRSVAQAGSEISAMLSGRRRNIHQNHTFTTETLTKAAEMNLTSIIPESYLWRLLLQFINQRKPEDFKNNFLIANDRCSWSKILSLFTASLKTTLAEDIAELAKKAGIEMKIDLPEVKSLYQ